MKLLIPGPVSTSPAVRAALAQDFAPWDRDFAPLYIGVRDRLRAIAGGLLDQHVAMALQGAGHFGLEAAVRSFVPAGGKLLVPLTGAYGERVARLAREAGRSVVAMPVPPDAPIAPAAIAAALAADPAIGHVCFVYSETSTGVVHDPVAIGAAVRAAGRRLIIDAVSAFGALPLDLSAQPEVDAAVFTANKCLEAIAGLVWIVARTDRLAGRAGQAGSWSFDLADIYAHALAHGFGSFRFTPPAQVLAALAVALDLFDAEGGQPARLARYTANMRVLHEGARALGLRPMLPAAVQGPIVMNIAAPADPAWDLHRFVDALKARGFLISNFYNTPEPSFRVGCIGAITPADMAGFVAVMAAALEEMGLRQRRAA